MENVLDVLVKYNSQTNGRDKLIRLVQYSSKFLAWTAENCKYEKQTITKLNDLESSLSSGRKLLRLGRSVDTMYSALKSIHLQDLTLRVTLTMARINQALYLLMDHVLWSGRVGLFEINTGKWSRRSNKFWLFSLMLLLARDIYELWHILNVERRLRTSNLTSSNLRQSSTVSSSHSYRTPSSCNSPRDECFYSLLAPVSRWAVQHKEVLLDTAKNACDLLLPLSGLGHVKCSNGLLATCGIISSAIGILTIVSPSCRLSP